MNSSASTPACLSTPPSVPTFNSRCIGTTHPCCPRRRITWLPRCRTCAKPSRFRTDMQSLPLILGSLGIRDLEGRQQGPATGGKGKLLEEKLGGLPEIVECFRHGLSLRGAARFWIERNV